MNKQQAFKTARAIALDSVTRNKPVDAAAVAELAASGYSLDRVTVGRMEGYKLASNSGAWFVMAPREWRGGKKQSAFVFDWADAQAYESASEALNRFDVELAEIIAKSIVAPHIAAALESDIAECFRVREEFGFEVEPAPEVAVSELEQVRAFVACIDPSLEVTQKREGCCIWCSGDTKPHKDELKAFGFKWAPKKGAWYWKPAA